MMWRLMRPLLYSLLVLAACHGSDPAKPSGAGSAPATTPSAVTTPTPAPAAAPADAAKVAEEPAKPPEPVKPPEPPPTLEGHDFTPEGKALLAVGACGDGPVPDTVPKAMLDAHCAIVKEAQQDYLDKWVKPAGEF